MALTMGRRWRQGETYVVELACDGCQLWTREASPQSPIWSALVAYDTHWDMFHSTSTVDEAEHAARRRRGHRATIENLELPG